MRLIPRDYMFEVLNGVYVSLLLPCNASELVTCIDLLGVDFQRAFESLACCVQFTTALMNKSQIVMRRSIRGIECCRFQVLFKCRLRAMAAHDVAEITAQEHVQQKQQKR